MKSFQVVITGDCPDTVPDALILRAGAMAAVPFLRPEEWVKGYELLCSNVTTQVTHNNHPAPVAPMLDDMALACIRKHKVPTQDGVGRGKIQAIKELQAMPDADLGLKEAKDHIDRLWNTV